MKIALIGYGRMGRMIEEAAKERGHEIVCRIDADNLEDFASDEFRSADVAIEFSVPSCAVDNILKAFAAGVPVVCGTTGWLDSLPEIQRMCDNGDGTLFYASNYSIGVNIFMSLNRKLAAIMNRFPQYSPTLNEVHHIHKLDHPSGTALTLARETIDEVGRLNEWIEIEQGVSTEEYQLGISHERRGEVPGIHTITWESDVDSISMTHSAKSRKGFAIGAVMAAEWLKGHRGFFTMREMLPELY
ncbi:MAG: 4-hydroxy-tetrahydrodipicolinate reductase [Prevotella sp.]|nr:4-hydroxy-tetrahydrodipicolinate reductase [Bacteroides sp.]MCM1366655.1 4-hydroxy-tetrahydrodipicolinate reductase [Prevotella sp.]MCM1437322.1 4-hydroxy-tetrahydrodipicolinate reductase [Prevotella sp.]